MALEEEGYVAIPAHGYQLLERQESLEQFLAEQAPHVILWDIAPPYDVNWRYFQEARNLPVMRSRPCILTTTNVGRLREIIDTPEAIIEIVGKPYDLEQILGAVKKALG
ncbi:MAG TPA: hypothetical protein VKT82_34855 [Ktedonobacterales bacterium]|nr:hypothetical protein [Ktedonobacterales bacterium]